MRHMFGTVPKMSTELHPCCCIVGGGMVVCWRLLYMICGTEARVEDSPDAAPRLLTLPLPTSVVEAIKVSLSKKLIHQSDILRVRLAAAVSLFHKCFPSVCTATQVSSSIRTGIRRTK